MSDPASPVSAASDADAAFGAAAHVALLRNSQNEDGGWGFHPGQRSRVEPTSWAVCVISGFDSGADREAAAKARNFLRSARLPDHSWPASPEMPAGSWVTSLVCLVLGADPGFSDEVKSALQWLCDDFPRDSSPLRRFLKALRPQQHISSVNDSYRGWGWTPQTSSWVEPTSFALMALREADGRLRPAEAETRRELAVALLYDRMCPAGGWNCGNPRVYGADGEALVLPTSWALLALSDAPERPGRALSLAWLKKEFTVLQSPASFAVARLALERYGIEPAPGKIALQDFAPEELAAQGIHVLAWVCLALNPARNWPRAAKI